MTDHIRLWALKLNTSFIGPDLIVTRNIPKLWLCENPDFDIELMNNGYADIYFWRTDRELVNCFRCLAILRGMENYD